MSLIEGMQTQVGLYTALGLNSNGDGHASAGVTGLFTLAGEGEGRYALGLHTDIIGNASANAMAEVDGEIVSFTNAEMDTRFVSGAGEMAAVGYAMAESGVDVEGGSARDLRADAHIRQVVSLQDVEHMDFELAMSSGTAYSSGTITGLDGTVAQSAQAFASLTSEVDLFRFKDSSLTSFGTIDRFVASRTDDAEIDHSGYVERAVFRNFDDSEVSIASVKKAVFAQNSEYFSATIGDGLVVVHGDDFEIFRQGRGVTTIGKHAGDGSVDGNGGALRVNLDAVEGRTIAVENFDHFVFVKDGVKHRGDDATEFMAEHLVADGVYDFGTTTLLLDGAEVPETSPSSDELMGMVNDLLAQVAELQAELGAA